MSRSVKVLSVLVGVVVLLAVALVILIKTQLTPERIRSTLIPVAERHLDRSVEVGEIRIGFFSGVTLEQVEISEQQSADAFLLVDRAQLTYRLWPLLRGQLEISDLLLEQPKIRIERRADGLFNFSDLLAKDNSDAAPDTASGADDSGAPFDLLIQRISLRNGEVLFIDRLINPTAPFRYNLRRFNMNIKQLRLDQAFPVEISVVLNDSQVDMTGKIDLARNSGEMIVKLTPLDLVPFAPYYRDQLPGTLGAARLGLNIELDWSPQGFASRGKLTMEQVDLVLADLPDYPLRDARVGADYSLRYDADTELLDIITLTLRLNEISGALRGKLNLAPSEPRLDATLDFARLDLRQAIQSLPQGLARQMQSSSPAGDVSAQLQLQGPVSAGARLVQAAQISLKDLRASVNTQRLGINGALSYADQQLVADRLLLKVGDQQAQLTFALNNLVDQPVTGTFSLQAGALDLNLILPAEDADQDAAPAAAGTAKAVELGPYDLPLSLTGTINVDRLLYRRLVVQQLEVGARLENNRLTLAPVSGQVSDGRFELSSSVDLAVKGLAYQGEMSLTQPDLGTLGRGLFPAAATSISGQTQWQNRFSGRGTIVDTLLPRLQLDGSVTLQQGAVSGAAVLDQLAWFLNSPDLKTIRFSEFLGSYRIRNGRAQIDSHMDGERIALAPSGSVGLDGSLDLKLPVRLSPEVMTAMGGGETLQRALVDSNGWGVLPLQISGSLTKPQVALDSSSLEQQAVEQLKETFEERVLEKILPQEEQSKEPLRQLLDNTLRRLRTQ